jgi:protease IV
LASDLIWREVRKIAQQKPLVATMGDEAGSGGYYISMAAPTILAQPLTLTGSIGVFLFKFNLAELYEKVHVKSLINALHSF